MGSKKEYEVEIDSFSDRGRGIAHYTVGDGSQRKIEIPFTCPGDHVRIEVVRNRRGRLLEIVTPSEKRIVPKCPHFTSCGGCALQHLSYNEQLVHKEQLVRRCLSDVDTESASWYPIVRCDPPWHYRNKMEFSFSQDRKGERFLGLLMPGGKGRVCNLSECHLCPSWFMDAADRVREWWKERGLHAYFHRNDHGALRTLTLREGRNTGDKMVVLLVSGNPEFALSQEDIATFKALFDLENESIALFIRIQQIKKGEPTRFYEMHLGGPDHYRELLTVGAHTLEFAVSPSAFFQPSTPQAERIYSRALEMIEIPAKGLVFDLYCGTGTLGILAAKRCERVIGIELCHEAVIDAGKNAEVNGVKNIVFRLGDVGKVLKEYQQSQEDRDIPHTVMVDPPRSGLGVDAGETIVSLKPKQILYISCHPKTLGEDLVILTKNGYQVESVQPVDQFAHTPHMETIVVLKEKIGQSSPIA